MNDEPHGNKFMLCFGQAYYILDELYIGGEMQECSKKEILKVCAQQEDLMEEGKEDGPLRPRVGPR